MKKLLFLVAILLGGGFSAYLKVPEFNGFVNFVGWKYQLVALPDFESVLDHLKGNVVTISGKTPDPAAISQLKEALLKAIQSEQSSQQNKKLLDDEFKKIGIAKPFANAQKATLDGAAEFDKLRDAVFDNLSANSRNISVTTAISVKTGSLKQVNLLNPDYKKDIPAILQVQAVVDLGERKKTSLAFWNEKKAKDLLLKFVKESKLPPASRDQFEKLLAQTQMNLEWSRGVPTLHANLGSDLKTELYLTFVGDRLLLITNQKQALENLLAVAVESTGGNQKSNESPIFKLKLDAKALMEELPASVQAFTKSFVKDFGTAEISAGIDSNIYFAGQADFGDATSAHKILQSLEMARALRPASSNAIEKKMGEATKMTVLGSALHVEFKMPMAQVTQLLTEPLKTKSEFMAKNLATTKTIWNYMTSYHLVKIEFKDSRMPASVPAGSHDQYQIRHEKKNWTAHFSDLDMRPVMIVSQLECQSEAQIDFLFSQPNSTTPIRVHSMAQPSSEAKLVWSQNWKDQKIQALLLSGAPYMRDLNLEIDPKESTAAVGPGQFAPPDYFKAFKPICEFAFIPFVLAQSK